MKCSHCGTDLPPNAKYCPNCAEPVIVKPKPESYEDRQKRYRNNYMKGKSIIALIIFFCSLPFTAIVVAAITDNISSSKAVLYSVMSALVIAVCYWYISMSYYFYKTPNQRNIEGQFSENRTSICPNCGCHSITIYRKGYNWNGAFWGSVFKIKGSRYIAGMDSNNAICRCDNCGHEWDSGYNYSYAKQRRK